MASVIEKICSYETSGITGHSDAGLHVNNNGRCLDINNTSLRAPGSQWFGNVGILMPINRRVKLLCDKFVTSLCSFPSRRGVCHNALHGDSLEFIEKGSLGVHRTSTRTNVEALVLDSCPKPTSAIGVCSQAVKFVGRQSNQISKRNTAGRLHSVLKMEINNSKILICWSA